MKPLEGLLVLDFTHAAAGPLCTMLLADFGATVIKVEKPGRGDGSRYMNMDVRFDDHVLGGDYFLSLNRNKQSVAIDLSTPEGRDLARGLALKADVLAENHRPGTLDKHGLGWKELREANPRLIYCGISAFGRSAEEAAEAGMDVVVQARAGTISITGEPGGPPAKPGVSIADMSGGLQAAIGVLLALAARERTGRGQLVDVNLFDATLLMMANFGVGILNTDARLTRMGTGHPQLCPYQAFMAKDGEWVFVGAGTNSLWRKLCRGLGREDLAQDARFSRNQDRVRHRAELVPIMADIIAQRPSADLIAMLKENGIPYSLLSDPKTAYQNAFDKGRNIVKAIEHPVFGRLLVPGLSINLSDTAGEVRGYPPRLGEHTVAVLRNVLDLSESECRALQERGVIDQVETGTDGRVHAV